MITALLLLAAAPEPQIDCDEPMAQQEMNQCARRSYEAVDAEMNVQWRLAVAAMRAADKEVDRKNDLQPLHYDTLLAAQRAWLNFRDESCLLASFEARGGSMQPMLDSGCKAQMTRERTKQLKEMAGVGN